MEQVYERGGRQRRALNMVWTAAGEYGFMPDFLAFHRDGSPDLYLNSVIGFARRFYEAPQLSAYIRTLDDSLLRDVFTDILWLGIEHAVYEREAPLRPVLVELREMHARQFLRDEIDTSMQQLMMRSDLIHTLKAGRCHEVLDGVSGIRNPWERRLYESLRYPGTCGTEELIERTQDILRRFFVFHFTDVRHGAWHISLGTRLNTWLRRILPMERHYVDSLELLHKPVLEPGSGAPGEQDGAAWRMSWGHSSGQDFQEIQERFGSPLYGEEKRQLLEREFCWGNHQQAKLYFAKGRGESQARTENYAFFMSRQRRYKLCIRDLTRRLQSCLSVYRQPVPVRSQEGQLEPSQVWRGTRLNDNRVFTASVELSWADFEVILLLDGSASRAGQQSLIAAQAYAIAVSLEDCGIPVQVVSFASLHGYTVFRQLKSVQETDCQTVFDYFALGWNRDGLALRSIPALFSPGQQHRQLVLVLTDAHPSDELGMPLAGGAISRNYMDEEAVRDAAAEACTLRQHGVRLVGLIDSVVRVAVTDSAAREIYGQDCARIESVDRLARVVGGGIERQIRMGLT